MPFSYLKIGALFLMVLAVSSPLTINPITTLAYADDEEGIEPAEPSIEPFDDGDASKNEYDEDSATIAKGDGKVKPAQSGSMVSQSAIQGKVHNVLTVIGTLTIINTDAQGDEESPTNMCWVRVYFGQGSFWDMVFWVTFKEIDITNNNRVCEGESTDNNKKITVTLKPGGGVDWHVERVFKR